MAGPLDHFSVEAAGGGSIGTQVAGTPFSIKITAKDASNITVTAFTGTVNITSTGTLSAGGGTTAAFTAGVLASHSVTISNTGTFTLTATKTAGTETGTSNAFTVNAPPMPAPTFQLAGTAQASTAAIAAVAWPSHQTDDIGLLIVETANQAVTLTGSDSANWAAVTGSPQSTGTAAATSATRLSVFWRRATSSTMAAVGISDSGDHQYARILAFRGVHNSGNPWDGTPAGNTAAASTAVVIPGATTSVDNTLVVAIVAAGRDVTSTAQTSAWANTTPLTSLTEQADGYTSLGNGGGFSAATGVMASAGTYANTTATLASATAAVQGRLSLALRPPACGADTDVSHVSASTPSTTSVTLNFPSSTVIVLRKTGSDFTGGELPANGTSYPTSFSATGGPGGTTVVSNSASALTSVTDNNNGGGLAAGTKYYYRVVTKGGGPCYATGAAAQTGLSITPGQQDVAWSYVRSGGSMLKPGIAGVGKLYPSSNSGYLVSLETTGANAGGESWPTPVASTSTGASQSFQGWMTWITASSWYNSAWSSRKMITIDRTKVGAGGVTNFPVLISRTTDTDLQSKAQADGDDILFTSSDGTSKLSHEIEKYVTGTGELVAWVKVPSVSASADTVLYMYYGNASAPNQQDAAGVWSNSFVGVWHLGEASSGSSAVTRNNSTSGNNALTDINTVASGAGKIGDGADFERTTNETLTIGDGTDVGLDPASTSIQWTYSAWFKAESTGIGHYLVAKHTSNVGYHMNVQTTNTLNCKIQNQADVNSTSTIVAGTWYYFTCAWDGSNIRLYWNGSNQTTLAYTGGIGNSVLNFYVGGPTAYSDGVIDEVRVSNVARPAAWITTEYNNQSSPSTFYTVGAESGGDLVLAGDQGGKVYAVSAATGAPAWTEYTTGAAAIQAGLAVQLARYSDPAFQTQYGATTDIIFAASMNGDTTNKLFAIKASDGTLAWSFNGTVDTGNSVNDITGMPYVDYSRNRIYVAAKAASGRSLWVINSLNGSSIACTSTDCEMGELDSSPSLSSDWMTLYVGDTAGNLYALDLSGTPTRKWTFALGVGNGNLKEKGFVWEDYTTAGRLYFTTTTGKVMCVQDNGTSAALCTDWTSIPTIAGASSPLLMNKLFVSSSNGKVYQIDPDGVNAGQCTRKVDIDLTPKIVGDVSTETGSEIFVGTEGGKIYKVTLSSGALPGTSPCP